MNTADWIVVILLLLWAVTAAISISKQKKKGKCCGKMRLIGHFVLFL